MTRAEEQELIRRAAAGDRSAAEACIRAHQQSLFAYMLRMSGRPDVAEDIVQEAFVRVLTNLDRFDDRYRFSTWLFTIAKRLYVNTCQKHKPIYDSDIVEAWQGAGCESDWSPTRDEIQENVRSALDECLQMLPERQREIIILFHQQDWRIAVIARHLDMPEGTVKSHLHRGRRKLRLLLEARETLIDHVQEVWN
ncbi:MAG: sigma-70 family RNA polymerase sigma factor [Planctomycetes bacterium]|nr:sigma-70 family RNA polymerase sigma factor [Planctomycetota bacterium]